jgi:hypothetical protein
MSIPLIDKFALDALRGRDTPRLRCQRAAARVTGFGRPRDSGSLAETFDERNGALNGVEPFAEISPKSRLQERRCLRS